MNNNKVVYNQLNNNKLRGGVFDILKIVCCFLIVFLHSGITPTYLLPIVRLAVPLFFLMSSFFYYSKVHQMETFSDRKDCMIRYVKRIFSLYLFWAIVLLPVTIVLQEERLLNIGYLLKLFFVDGIFGGSWFLIYSGYSVLLLFVLTEHCRFNNKVVLLIASFLYVLALLTSNYSGLIGKEIVSNINANYVRGFNSLPASLIWFIIGKIIAENKSVFKFPKRSMLVWMLIFLVLYYCEYLLVNALGLPTFGDCFIMLIPLCVIIFFIFLNVKDFSFKQQKLLRKTSTIVYCSHKSVLPILGGVSAKLCHLNMSSILFLTIFICLLLTTMILLLDKTKAHRIIRFAY